MQSDAWSLPVTSTYEPATQSIHVLSVEDELYFPIAHAMQLVPLAATPTPVSEPARQSAQPVIEFRLYLPAEHGVQEDAPVDVPVFVSDPGGHSAQSTIKAALYRPTVQATQPLYENPPPEHSTLADPVKDSVYPAAQATVPSPLTVLLVGVSTA